jgi:hypothetical protein
MYQHGVSFDRVPFTTSSELDTSQHASSPSQTPNSSAFFTSSHRVPDTRNDTGPSSMHRVAPKARFVSQNASLTSLLFHVLGTWQLIRATSFTEALKTLRFGDPDTLYMPSVMAGYIQRCFHGRDTQAADGRPISEYVTYYDYLLFCLTARRLDLRYPIVDMIPVRLLYLNNVVRSNHRLHTGLQRKTLQE